MSVRILRDIEEALSREVRRITFHDDRTPSMTVLKDTFDPFTGESVSLPIEANFYDSSANTRQIQYPHFFLKLVKMAEDRFSKRVVPQYGRIITSPIITSQKAFKVILGGSDGLITAPGNTLTTNIFKIKTVQVGYLLKLTSGNNIGTYKISAVTPSNTGDHTLTVSNTLLEDLPSLGFDSGTREISFLEGVDLSTVKVGDVFTDSLSVSWNITAVDSDAGKITIDGSGSPSLLEDSSISRTGNVFQNTDPSLINYSVLDGSQPVKNASSNYSGQAYANNAQINPAVPVDIYYLVRIDSKERDTHIDVANRMWEEFNPPRTALPTIVRSKLSVDKKLITDVTSGGSSTIEVENNADYSVGDSVFIFDELTPTKKQNGDGFEQVFTAKIIDKISNTQLVLDQIVPDTFTVYNTTRVVSNAEYCLLMFHYVDHITRDVEEAQYWSHEFTFWIQAWIDRQGEPVEYEGVVQHIGNTIELLPDEIIVSEEI